MRMSFSRGVRTVVYYCVAAPITISLVIIIWILADLLKDRAQHPALQIIIPPAVFLKKTPQSSFSRQACSGSGKGSVVMSGRHQQAARDKKAAKLASQIKAAVTSRENVIVTPTSCI